VRLDPAMRHLLLSLVACVLAAAVWGATWYPPLRSESDRLRLQRQSLQSPDRTLTNPAAALRLQSEIDAATAQLRSLRERHPTDVREASLLAEVARMTDERQLDVRAMTVTRPIAEPPFLTWTLDLRVVGAYPALLDLLAELEAPGRAHGISWLQLRVMPDAPNLELRLRYHLRALASSASSAPT
jgi:Tfp pilus assembly protein PilO